MKCIHCQQDIPAWSKFCPECGTRLSGESRVSSEEAQSIGLLRTMATGPEEKRRQPEEASLGSLATLEGALEEAEAAAGLGGALSKRYRLERSLGEGGFARVWLGEDLKLGRQVAIKRLKLEAAAGKDGELARKRFLQESQAVARLNHRNIVQVFDADYDEEGPYIVMEYVDGPTLREYLRQKERLDLPVALQLFQGIAQGVAFSHRHNIIHRDLKPANILLASETGGESGRLLPKIVDFGLARIGGDSGLSQSGYGMGTQGYMPPEQRRDAKSVNHTADIYALGKILYELVSGAGPDDVLPNKIPPPPVLAQVIFRCIEDNPTERYFSVGELLGELSQVLEQSVPATSGDFFDDNICPSCQMRNRDGVKFCVSCGAGLTCLCPECECEHPVSRPFCGECGTEVKAFLSVRDVAQKMRAYSDDKKWSRVAKEYGLVPENVRLPGAKGQELLAEIKALNEAATAALRRRDELLSAIATAMAERNYTAAARAVTECLEIAPEDAVAREARERLDKVATQAKAATAELEAAIASGRRRHALQLAAAAKHDFPDSEALADLHRKAVAVAVAERKNVDDFVAGISVARALYEDRRLVSGNRQLAQLRALRDSIGDVDDSTRALRMQSALESLAVLEKDYSVSNADYAALLTAAQEKLSQYDYDACSVLCSEANALNIEGTAAEEMGKTAVRNKTAVAALLRKAKLALAERRWTEAEATCQALWVYHRGHVEVEQLLLHCQEKKLAHHRKMKQLAVLVIVFLALLAGILLLIGK